MRMAVSADGKELEEPKILPTPQDFAEGIAIFENLAKELAQGEKIQYVAGGVAGPLDREKTMLLNSPNIPGWIKKPLKGELEKRIGSPVFLENDTAMGGLGEVTFGAAKGYSIAVYISVATGVGGARFVHGKIDQNAMGFEPGHQIIDFNSHVSCGPGCKGEGHLEAFVSGSALERRSGKKAVEVLDPAVWDELARILAVGLNNTIVHWSPDVVVLGGAMITGEPSIPWDALERYYKETVTIFSDPPPLFKATLKDAGGLYGALALAKQYV